MCEVSRPSPRPQPLAPGPPRAAWRQPAPQDCTCGDRHKHWLSYKVKGWVRGEGRMFWKPRGRGSLSCRREHRGPLKGAWLQLGPRLRFPQAEVGAGGAVPALRLGFLIVGVLTLTSAQSIMVGGPSRSSSGLDQLS